MPENNVVTVHFIHNDIEQLPIFQKKSVAISFFRKNQIQLQTKNVFRLKQQINLPLLSHLLEFCFLRKLFTNSPSRFPDLQINALPNLLTWISHAMATFENLRHMTSLPAYSDRIAQDSHLIPYYPRNYNRFEALENSVKA